MSVTDVFGVNIPGLLNVPAWASAVNACKLPSLFADNDHSACNASPSGTFSFGHAFKGLCGWLTSFSIPSQRRPSDRA